MALRGARNENGRQTGSGFLGSRIESRLRVRSYVPNFEQDEHAHDEAQLTMLLAGSVEEWSAGQCFASGPLDVIVKPAQVSHANRFGPSETLTLQVSLGSGANSALQACGVPLSRVTWRSSELATRYFLQALAGNANSGAAGPTCGQTLEISALRLDSPQDQFAENFAPSWLAEVWQQLSMRFSSPVTVRSLAKEAGVHPVHLARTARQHYGVSITGRLRQLRAAATAGLLCQSDLPLSAIATDCGFADQSHMCRVFKSYTSLTPLEFRRLASR